MAALETGERMRVVRVFRLSLHAGVDLVLYRISKDLYSEVTHFIMELVQNADDNTYPEGVTPSLILELKGRVLSIRCNEVGFSEANVRALCAVKASTKKDPSRYIGETCYE